MCPSGGRGGGLWDRLRRLLRDCLRRELRPVTFLLPAALLLVYCFPLLSALLLCAAAGWAYRSGRLWRLCAPRAAIARHRPALYRRAASRWSPASWLLLMGSYLGKQEPPPRGAGRGARELKERLSRPNPAVPTPARRLSFRETPPLATNRPLLSPCRRYPTHQPQYSLVGSLPTMYVDGFARKTLLSPKRNQLRSPVTVKIPRPDPNIARSPILNSLLSPRPASPSVTSAPPDPCAKETVLNAIRESRKRMNKDEQYLTREGIENKRRRQVSSGSGESSSGTPVINGSLSYVSNRSEVLKRALNTQTEETVNKRSRTSSNSSLSSCTMNGFTMPTHNAITSSFSSSRVLIQKRKRNCQTSVISSLPSSRSQTPDLSAKKAREELHDESQSTPVKSGSRDQAGQINETPSSNSTVNSSDKGSGPRRKKVLLVCPGRGDQYQLPPPPVIGYNITSKDLDSEKKAFLQRLNKALEDTADAVPASSAPSTATTISAPPLFSLSSAPALTSQTSTASGNPLLQSLAKMQNKEGSQEPVQEAAADFPNRTVSLMGLTSPKEDSGPCQNVSLKLTSQPVAVVPSNSTSQVDSAVQNKSESKSSLLQLLTQPSENDPQSSFKPLFPSNANANPPIVSSSGPSMPSISSANTFKPIFGEQNVQQNQPANTFKPIFGDSSVQQPVTSASPFTFQVNANPSSTAPPSFSGFASTATNTNPSTDSITKPPLSLLTSSSTTTSFSSTFSGGVTSSSIAASAPTNTFLGSSTSSDSQAKTTFVFGQAPTSQATPALNIFGNTQTAPAAQPQKSSMFGSTSSAFSAAVNSNPPPPYPASSGTSTFNSSSGSSVQADKPATNPLASFATPGGQSTFGSGTQFTFGSNAQTAFGANSQPAFCPNATFAFGPASATTNPTTFGTMNSTQTNSNPTTNQFASKPFTFGEKNTAVSFATTSTMPAPAMTFGNASVAQNSTSLSFVAPGPTENKPSFVPPAAPFGQNASSAPVNFGTTTPSFGTPAGSFGQANHGFSIGVTSKASGARQRLMARRQHTRKK